MTKNLYKNLTERADQIDTKIIELAREIGFHPTPDIEIQVDPVNVHYGTNKIECAVFGMRFKPNTDHSNYTDLLGSIRIVFEIDEDIIKIMLSKAIEMCVTLLKSGVYQNSDDLYLKLVYKK